MSRTVQRRRAKQPVWLWRERHVGRLSLLVRWATCGQVVFINWSDVRAAGSSAKSHARSCGANASECDPIHMAVSIKRARFLAAAFHMANTTCPIRLIHRKSWKSLERQRYSLEVMGSVRLTAPREYWLQIKRCAQKSSCFQPAPCISFSPGHGGGVLGITQWYETRVISSIWQGGDPPAECH
jgi:hypothetical protein